MCTMICHYDTQSSAICESVTLVNALHDGAAVQHVTVLVSASNFHERQHAYSAHKSVRVVPLLLPFQKLTTSQLMEIMNCSEGEQLYVAVIKDLIKEFVQSSATGQLPPLHKFEELLVSAQFSTMQKGPLDQRLRLLHALVRESKRNAPFSEHCHDVFSLFQPGELVILDLSDPFLTMNEANSIFNIMLQTFRDMALACGKVIVLDEAHKYMETSSNALANSVVSLVRQMRHTGIRVVISTQNPSVLPKELLELVSVVVLHHFFSPSWFHYLQSMLPLPDQAREFLAVDLANSPGRALVFGSRAAVDTEGAGLAGSRCVFDVQIRPRLTADAGYSITNS
eukprot:TRINITY_DN6481_c0_g1_i1.p1 TRINITY_DN6481_c0_g1~~TRINITY_DN6481_c0_g1_i1.p1  ORF type:complete len:339 (+),score=68.10 TRINITY_DN6481_c0_g1_i1:922-1938(+)